MWKQHQNIPKLETIELPSGNLLRSYFSNGQKKIIVDFPMKSMVDLSSSLRKRLPGRVRSSYFGWTKIGPMESCRWSVRFFRKMTRIWSEGGYLVNLQKAMENGYRNWWTYKKLWKMAIDIVDFPIENGVDFPLLC